MTAHIVGEDLLQMFPLELAAKTFVIAFIAVSTVIMVVLGGAKRLVILAGAINGVILPVSLACMLLGCNKKEIVGEYKHPKWLAILGWIVVAITGYLAITTLPNIMNVFK